MYLNKWIQFALSLAIVITGAMAGFDWTTVFSAATSAKIAGIIGFVKLVTNALAPKPGQSVAPASGVIVAHSVKGQPS